MPRKEPRNYKKEYQEYHGKPEQRQNRSKRNQARRKMKRTKGDGTHVDHKIPLSKNGSNSRQNLAIKSPKENRKKGNRYA